MPKSKPVMASAAIIWANHGDSLSAYRSAGVKEALEHNLEYAELFFFLLVAAAY